jgi:sodium-coupled neutral amino acid transporter 11
MALGGFLTFGDKTMGNVLNNFSSDNSMVNVARLCFGLNMLTTLPLEAFVCREVMITYFYPGEPFDLRRHLIISTALVMGATTLSMLTCDLGVVFEFVGATSAVAMAYILPPMCYIKLTTRSWRTYVAAAIVVFGVAVMVISVIQAIDKMINGKSLCCANALFTPHTHANNAVLNRFRNHSAMHVETRHETKPTNRFFYIN